MPSLSKQGALVLGLSVALHRTSGEAYGGSLVENLSKLTNFVLSYVSALIVAEGVNILPVIVVILILVLLVARIIKRKRRALKAFGARDTLAFGSRRSPALKPCPNCTEQLPLSAIICDNCEYNFLAQRPGRGQKLLPSAKL